MSDAMEDVDVEQRLAMAQSQLALFAADLRRTLDEERRKTQALTEAHRRLQVLDRLKTDFLSFVAHELRTPLSCLAAVTLIDPDNSPADQREIGAIVRGGYARLDALISSALEYFGWLSAPPLTTVEPVDLAAVVAAELGPVRAAVAPGLLHVVVSPCTVLGVERHLRRAVGILFSNAVKFSGGAAPVRIELRTAERVELLVADGGSGFRPDLANEIFRPFTIADVGHHSQGTGLGVALAHAIATAHGGTISARSDGPGTGATFVVSLPKCADAARGNP